MFREHSWMQDSVGSKGIRNWMKILFLILLILIGLLISILAYHGIIYQPKSYAAKFVHQK